MEEKSKAGRPKGPSGKYRNPETGEPIGVFEWRKLKTKMKLGDMKFEPLKRSVPLHLHITIKLYKQLAFIRRRFEISRSKFVDKAITHYIKHYRKKYPYAGLRKMLGADPIGIKEDKIDGVGNEAI